MIPALFVGFSAVLLISALMVVLHRNPITSALFLVVAFCSLAGIYILMRAEFIGMVQIIVYAGAIMVLFLFVIMYLNLGHDLERGALIVLRRMIGWVAGALVVLQGVLLFAGRWAMGPVSQAPPPAVGNTQALGQALYSRYLYPFEITSLVLLVAMVGAIVISKGHGGRGTGPGTGAATPRPALRPGDSMTPPGATPS
jgi:NADH-quinone oxidoreductase subunit J